MPDVYAEFNDRVRKLSRKHTRMARGVVTSVNHDGLIIAKPRRRGLRFPVRGPALFLAVFFFFKGFLIAGLGPIGYAERVEALNAGTLTEQLGGYVMNIDPISLYIAQTLAPYLN